MNKKVLFTFFVASVLLFSAKILAQETIELISYYPSPYGFYNKLSVAPDGGKRIGSDNTVTLLRIGVDANEISSVWYGGGGLNYVPSIIEINGEAWWPEIQNPRPQNIGLFSRGDVGIAAVTENSNFPAILGYKAQELLGYAICGIGPRGVYGKSTRIGGIGVHGSANDTGSCGVVGTNNVTVADNMPALPQSIDGKSLNVGVYGSGKGNEDVPSLAVAKETGEPLRSGVGVLGNGTAVGVMGVVDGKLNNPPVGKYAGYFDGDVKVTKRAILGIPNIPVFNSLSEVWKTISPTNTGDMAFIKPSREYPNGALLICIVPSNQKGVYHWAIIQADGQLL